MSRIKKLGKRKKKDDGKKRPRVMWTRVEVKIVKEWVKKNGPKRFGIPNMN